MSNNEWRKSMDNTKKENGEIRPLTANDLGLHKPVYSIGELIEKRITGGRTTTYKQVKDGRLRVVKRGKSTLVLTPDLVAYLNALRGDAV
jgi:hypothetical protein